MTNSRRMEIVRRAEKLTAEVERELQREYAREGLRRVGIEERFWR